MAELSTVDLEVIANSPLGYSLDHLTDVLRKAELPDPADGFKKPANPRQLIGVIEQLLVALRNHDAAFNIISRQSGRNLNKELLTLTGRIDRSSDYEYFRSLVRVVIQRASDAAIWTAVLSLVAEFPRITTPPSTSASFDGTPVCRSTSSFKDQEQTKKLLDEALKYELTGRVYRNVGGFFTKYFEKRPWSGRCKKIYTAIIKTRHVNEQWIDFPDPPEQEAVWSWLAQLQDDFWNDGPGAYYTTKIPSDIKGDAASRQLDIFLKRKRKPSDSKHEWKDVLVVGEHKQSCQTPNELLIQLSRYMRDVFSNQPTRLFAHGFFLHGSKMELWIFDRSGSYSSGAFDIHEEPEKFIGSLVGYALMTDEELGLDDFIRSRAGITSITIASDARGEKRKFQVNPYPFVKQRAVVCRGTTCFRSTDGQKVIKFSWTSDKRPPESELLRLAQERGVEGVAKFVGYHRITSIDELRSGLSFGRPWAISRSTEIKSTSSQSQFERSIQVLQVSERTSGDADSRKTVKRESCARETTSNKRPRNNYQTSNLHHGLDSWASTSLYEPGHDKYDNRLLGCLVISPAGRGMNEFDSIRELLTTLRDAIKAHKSLYFKGEILHRDISENNIIITNSKTAAGFTGMLIDLDLAKLLGSGRTGARHQTGTMEFMAIEVLRKAAHTYRHDLESFFYVLLWICGRRVWERRFLCSPRERPKLDVLTKWYRGSFEEIARSKQGDMHADGFDQILSQFPSAFNCVKPLCSRIRRILFPLTKEGKLDTGTPPEATKLYDEFIGEFDIAITGLLMTRT